MLPFSLLLRHYFAFLYFHDFHFLRCHCISTLHYFHIFIAFIAFCWYFRIDRLIMPLAAPHYLAATFTISSAYPLFRLTPLIFAWCYFRYAATPLRFRAMALPPALFALPPLRRTPFSLTAPLRFRRMRVTPAPVSRLFAALFAMLSRASAYAIDDFSSPLMSPPPFIASRLRRFHAMPLHSTPWCHCWYALRLLIFY